MTDALEKIRARAQAALTAEEGFDKRVALDFGEAGYVFVDGPAGVVSGEQGEADCTVRVSLDNFVAIARGALDPAKAFLSGRLKIDGDMGLAISLAQRMRAALDD